MKMVAPNEAWTGVADCMNCKLRQTALFADLKEEDFAKLHSPVDQYDYPEGTPIYRAGECHNAMYTIRSGLVKLVQVLPDGTQRIVRLLRAGDVTGLECFAGDEYLHDAIALHRTQICRLPAKEVKNLAQGNPALFNELMKRWQKAVSDADFWLTGFSTGSARQRVARLLIRMSDSSAGDMCRLFGREDLGDILGITTETASRIMAEFKRQGLIVENAQNTFQCDITALQKIIDG